MRLKYRSLGEGTFDLLQIHIKNTMIVLMVDGLELYKHKSRVLFTIGIVFLTPAGISLNKFFFDTLSFKTVGLPVITTITISLSAVIGINSIIRSVEILEEYYNG